MDDFTTMRVLREFDARAQLAALHQQQDRPQYAQSEERRVISLHQDALNHLVGVLLGTEPNPFNSDPSPKDD